MDYQIIYYRTPAGESAVTQRTRIIQRNLRNMLDLVDGKRTVAEIVKKFGDAAIAEAALADLERSGYIETEEGRQARGASVPPAAPAAAQAGEPAADKGAKSKADMVGDFEDEDITIMDPLEFPEAGSAAKQAPPEPRDKGFPFADDEELTNLPLPEAPANKAQPAEAEPSAAAATVRFEPLPSRKGAALRALKYVVIGVATLIVLAAGTLFFFPYDTYLPRIELRVRNQIGEPIRFEAMHVVFLPRPALVFDGVAIGGEREINVARIRVAPRLAWLVSSPKIVDEIVLDQVDADAAALPRVAEWLGARADPYFVPRGLRYNNVTVRLGKTKVEGIGGEAVLDEQGSLRGLRFVNAAGNLGGELKPQGKGYLIKLSANEWRVPGYEWIQFIGFEAAGTLTANALSLENFDGRSLDGVVAGKALFGWPKGAEFSSVVELKRVALSRVLVALRNDLRFEGDLSGTLAIEARGESFDTLRNAIELDGQVTIARGVLNGMDFPEAVRSRNQTPTRGGQTRFEQGSASFRLDGDTWRVSNLTFQSGLMRADGYLNIGPQQVSGAVDVAFLGGSEARALVAVSGPLKDPQLTATRR